MPNNAIISLVNPKNPINVGAVIRGSSCFGVSTIYYSGNRFDRANQHNKGHSQLKHSDTQNAASSIKLTQTNDLLGIAKEGMRTVCVELVEGADTLINYTHYEESMYIFGPEDGSIPQNMINQADDIIFIPTNGCLNLATTVSIILYDRMVKLGHHSSHSQLTENELIRNSRDTNNQLKVIK